MADSTPDPLAGKVSRADVIREYPISRDTLRRAINRGDLHVYERSIGRHRVWLDRAEIEDLLRLRPRQDRDDDP